MEMASIETSEKNELISSHLATHSILMTRPYLFYIIKIVYLFIGNSIDTLGTHYHTSGLYYGDEIKDFLWTKKIVFRDVNVEKGGKAFDYTNWENDFPVQDKLRNDAVVLQCDINKTICNFKNMPSEATLSGTLCEAYFDPLYQVSVNFTRESEKFVPPMINDTQKQSTENNAINPSKPFFMCVVVMILFVFLTY